MRDIPSQPTSNIASVEDLGSVIVRERKAQGLTQTDIAGLAQTGVRFVVDLEKGKPTIRMCKVLDVLELLGLELVVRRKGAP